MSSNDLISIFQDYSILELISYFNTHLVISEENLALIFEMNSPRNIVPLFFLLGRLGADDYFPRYYEPVVNYIDSNSSLIPDGIVLLIEEFLPINHSSDFDVKFLLSDLASRIKLWDPQYGINFFNKALTTSLDTFNSEVFDILVIDLIEEHANFHDYKLFLEIFHKSNFIYSRRKALNLLKVFLERIHELSCSHKLYIDIINSLKEGLDDDNFEIRWKTAKVISSWLKDLEMFKLKGEDLTEFGLADIDLIKNEIFQITRDFSKRITSHFEEEGSKDEKRLIRD